VNLVGRLLVAWIFLIKNPSTMVASPPLSDPDKLRSFSGLGHPSLSYWANSLARFLNLRRYAVPISPEPTNSMVDGSGTAGAGPAGPKVSAALLVPTGTPNRLVGELLASVKSDKDELPSESLEIA
jgi:hypothetical protein